MSELKWLAISDSMKEILRLARQNFCSPHPLFLQGEFGVGKKSLAHFLQNEQNEWKKCQWLHASLYSERDDVAFLSCFKVTEPICVVIESFETLSLRLQLCLLYVLQNLERTWLVSSKRLPKIKIVCISNVHIDQLLATGVLRQDLYYLLSSHVLTLPPLRARMEDLLPLVSLVFEQENRALNLTSSAVRCLTSYAWAGNIRELFCVVRAAIFRSSNDVIDIQDLLLLSSGGAEGLAPAFQVRNEQNIRSLERQHIFDTLMSVGGVKKLAAEKLGISERTLRYKLQRYREDEMGSV